MKFLRTLFVFGFFCVAPIHALPPVHVAIGQIVEHTALNALRESLKKGLEQQGFEESKNLTWTYENAQGNPTTAVLIGHKFISMGPTIIVTLSTPMTQAVAASTKSIPIVFGAVSDPVTAKLTNHKNVTGLTDFVPPEKQLELVKVVVPNVKAIGVIFNSGEANSQKQVQELKASAEKQGIQVIEATVSKSSDASFAAKALIGKVDAIMLPTDNTVISALESIIQVAIYNEIPVFGSDVDIVRRGAVAAYGIDWQMSGLALASMVGLILKGNPIKDVPLQNSEDFVLHVNLKAAQQMGVSIPNELKKKADCVL